MSKIPAIKQISWSSFIPQIILMSGLLYAFHRLSLQPAGLYAALAYLFLSFSLRFVLARHHHRGIRLVKKFKFTEAIEAFEKSAAFFARYPRIDKFRALTMLSSSYMHYREMALCNMAFCYAQSSDAKKAQELYALALREFPHSALARAGLNMLQNYNQ